jgi:transcriptional regulator with XRE-family HTH domain
MREEPRGIAGANAAHLAGMHGVTQAGLAAYIGRSVQGVWNVVHGRSEPTHATASAIADAFGITLDALYADTGTCVRAAADVFEQAPIRASLVARRNGSVAGDVGCAAAPDFLAARARDAPRPLPCPRG